MVNSFTHYCGSLLTAGQGSFARSARLSTLFGRECSAFTAQWRQNKMRVQARTTAAILSLTEQARPAGSELAPCTQVPWQCCQYRGDSTDWYCSIACERTQAK